jgi:hypothetical protein
MQSIFPQEIEVDTAHIKIPYFIDSQCVEQVKSYGTGLLQKLQSFSGRHRCTYPKNGFYKQVVKSGRLEVKEWCYGFLHR